MDRLFLTVLNMSISASFCILAVLFVRLLLRRTPRIFSYLLWAAVMIRLVCPVLPEADFGFIPDIRLTQSSLWQMEHSETTHEYYTFEEKEPGESGKEINGGFAAGVDSNAQIGEEGDTEVEYDYLPSERIRTKTIPDRVLEKGFYVIIRIWGLGVLGLVAYAGTGYAVFWRRIKRKEITTPCVTGFLHPTVYLPEGLDEMQKKLVLEHEKIHMKRMDYLVKPLAFLVCCIHWFNPLVWVFFFLMERDMEISCDEAVVQKIGYDRRKDYANTLLDLSRSRGGRAGYPIAFGENHVKSRIKSVVKIKKTGIGISIAAVVLMLTAMVFLLINRSDKSEQEPEPVTVSYQPDEKVTVGEPEENATVVEPDEKAAVGEPEEKSTFSLPDIKESIYLPNEDSSDGAATDIQSSEMGNQETIMNYDPGRTRDQFEVLNLPQVDENFSDAEILFSYPVEDARVSDGYGSRVHPVSGDASFHLGIDFAADEGTPVMAAADGTVVRTGFDSDCGNYLILLHENGAATYYFHCQDILAEEGQKVKNGEQIATVGSTGKSTGPHLHFGVSRDGDYMEPKFKEKQ